MNKTRNDSILFQLAEEQQAQVYDWLVTLGYTQTIDKLAAPPPDGFDIKTHRSCLHRFYKRYQQKVRTDDIAAAKENRSNTDDAPLLLSDAEQSFQHAGYQIATLPMTSGDCTKVSHWFEWQKANQIKNQYLNLAERQLALGEKRLAFDHYKFELNCARLALKHIVTLQEIHRDPALDGEDKIRVARDKLFAATTETLAKSAS